ncbi:hypothetical protein C8J57DRAFT_1716346 [Mycena rebaudengoi]|nr:hypothetical protein C8J57DRAFT_1716346 [Mycena rebaudengoi]
MWPTVHRKRCWVYQLNANAVLFDILSRPLYDRLRGQKNAHLRMDPAIPFDANLGSIQSIVHDWNKLAARPIHTPDVEKVFLGHLRRAGQQRLERNRLTNDKGSTWCRAEKKPREWPSDSGVVCVDFAGVYPRARVPGSHHLAFDLILGYPSSSSSTYSCGSSACPPSSTFWLGQCRTLLPILARVSRPDSPPLRSSREALRALVGCVGLLSVIPATED